MIIFSKINGQLSDLSFEVYNSSDYNLKGRIVHAAEDELGRMWFASNGGGVLIFNGYSFKNLVHIPGDSTTLISNNALSVFSIGSRMWVGNRYGFSTIDIHTLEVKNYQLGNSKVHPNEFFKNYSEAFLQDSTFFWISNINRLIKSDKDFNPIKSFTLPKIGPSEAKVAIVRLLQDKYVKNRIWIGSLYGMYTFDKQTEKIEFISNPKKWHNRSPEMKQYGYWDMFQATDSTIHSAAMHSGGLLSYHPNTKEWNMILYKSKKGQSPYLGNRAKSIGLINDSTYVLNMDLGIAFIKEGDKYYEEWKDYDLKNYGRSRDNYMDSKGHLWLCADNAILRSKLPLNSSLQTSITSLSSRIEGLDASKVEYSAIPHMLKVILAFNNPSNRNNVEYQYQLCDSEWQSIGNRRIIDLFNVRFGKHVFRSRAKEDMLGKWIYADPIEFEMERPFYLQPLNLIIFGLMLIGVFYLFWRLTRSRAIREEKIKHNFEKKILETEMRALRSQMNPHFIFNSLNSIYNFILQNETDQAADYLTKFSKLIRRVLNNSKKQTIALAEEIQTLKLYLDLEMVRIQEKFDYNISLSATIDSEHVFIPTMLIQPHLENAIWHGLVPKVGKGHIEMEIDIYNDLLEVKITDNGVGRDLSNMHQALKEKSLGSSITRDRLSLLGDIGLIGGEQQYIDLIDESGDPEGTRVILKIPFTNKSKKS